MLWDRRCCTPFRFATTGDFLHNPVKFQDQTWLTFHLQRVWVFNLLLILLIHSLQRGFSAIPTLDRGNTLWESEGYFLWWNQPRCVNDSPTLHHIWLVVVLVASSTLFCPRRQGLWILCIYFFNTNWLPAQLHSVEQSISPSPPAKCMYSYVTSCYLCCQLVANFIPRDFACSVLNRTEDATPIKNSLTTKSVIIGLKYWFHLKSTYHEDDIEAT